MLIARQQRTRNVLDATPATPVLMCSPILGDPDTANNVDLCAAAQLHTGFILPCPGVVTEIAFVAQGNTGVGVDRNVRYSICSVKSLTGGAGAGVDQVIHTGVTAVADNVNGLVTLVTGLSISVPSTFTLALKGPFRGVSSEKINAQAGLSAGPVPGVAGALNGANVLSAATYLGAFDVDAVDPAEEVPGTAFTASTFKATVCYVKWRCA